VKRGASETSDESVTALASAVWTWREKESFLPQPRLPEANYEYPRDVTADVPQTDAHYCKFPEPCAIVMFGASGDLARRKLLPALYDLAVHACLAPRFRLLGYARTEMNDDDFRKKPENSCQGAGGDGGGLQG
jgi:hypothetical protein